MWKYALFAGGVLLVVFLFTDTKIALPSIISFSPNSPLPNPDAGRPTVQGGLGGDSSYT